MPANSIWDLIQGLKG